MSDGLPRGWATSELKDVCRNIVDGSHNPPPGMPRGIPMLSARNIENGQVVFDNFRYIPESAFRLEDARTKLAPGDVLLTIVGSIGRSALVPEGQSFALQRSVAVLKPVALTAKFCMYQMQSPQVQRQLLLSSRGTAQKGVYLKLLGQIEIRIPPLDEQRRIVSEIEKQFTTLDAAVAALKRVQANLKRYRAAVLKAACEGRLVPTEAELARREGHSYERASELLKRILAERRTRWEMTHTPTAHSSGRHAAYRQPASPKTDALASLPEGWTWATWEQISPRVTVEHVGPMKDEYVSDGVSFLRSQNVRENRFDPEGLLHIPESFHQRLSKSVISSGDLVVVRSGSVGTTCVLPEHLKEANCADLVIIKQPIYTNSWYGSYYMNSLAKRYVQAGKVGVALTHFNTKSVAQLPVALPPSEEQSRIVAEA